MKDFQSFRKLVLLIVLIVQVHNIKAHNNYSFCVDHKEYDFFCDLCSCSTGSGSLGFGTLSNSNFVGVRYIYQKYESKSGIFDDSPITKESFNTFQLWAQIPINKSFFISANLPYQNLNRSSFDFDEKLNGFGDISLMGWYKVIFYKRQDPNMVSIKKEASGHSLRFGLGLKLPTGKFEESLSNNVNPGFQLGTGSVDGTLSLGYSYGKGKYGINTLFSYYLKGENKNHYQFGNQFSYNVNFYRAFSKKNVNIMPFIGMSGDLFSRITQYGEKLVDTSGNILNGLLGIEVAVNKIIFGTSYTLPVSQNLFNNDVRAKERLSVYVNYAL